MEIVNAGEIVDGAHVMPVRVYYEDTDAGGILYHAGHIRFFERGRSELVRALGFSQTALRDVDDVLFVVRRIEIDYLGTAVFDDLLAVRTRPSSLGGARFSLRQELLRGEHTIACAQVDCAAMSRTGRAKRLPAPVRDAFSALVANWQRNGRTET